MKAMAEISKADLIKVAKLQGFENKDSDMVHLYLEDIARDSIENHISGRMKLRPDTVEFLNSKY